MLLRGKACLKETAIKLAPLFETEGSKKSRWTWELLRIMAVCKTIEFRKGAIESIVISKFTLPYLLKKVRDIKDTVRVAVFEKLRKEKVFIDKLKLNERLELIYNGLVDRSEKVREACHSYLKDFMLENYEDKKFSNISQALQIFELLDVANLINNEEFCVCLGLLTKFILKEFGVSEFIQLYKGFFTPSLLTVLIDSNRRSSSGKCIETMQISNEAILLFRLACENLQENKAINGIALQTIEEILPDVCKMQEIIRYYKGKHDLFILNELLLLLPFYNRAEPKVNQKLLAILEDFFTDLALECSNNNKKTNANNIIRENRTSDLDEEPEINKEYEQLVMDQLDIQRRDIIVRSPRDLIPVSIRVLRKILSDDSNRYSEFIRMHIADLLEKMEDLKKQQEVIVAKIEDQNNETNARLEEELSNISQETTDCFTRALKLGVGLLQTYKVQKTDQFLMDYQNNLVKVAFENYSNNELINFYATQYLGLYAVIDFGKCVEFFQFFKDLISGISTTQTLKGIAALKSIFDFYMAYGSQMLKSGKKTNTQNEVAPIPEAASTLRELQRVLFSKNYRLRLLVYENFAKLILCDKLPRPEVYLLPLLIFIGDPAEAEENGNAIKQIVLLILKYYTKLSKNRCSKLTRAIVLLTLMWIKANNGEQDINKFTLMNRLVNFRYPLVVAHLVYTLTNTFIGTEFFVNLQESKENYVAEVMIMLLAELEQNEQHLPYLKRSLEICIRFIDLQIIKLEVLISLFLHWQKFMGNTMNKEKEYYSFSNLMRNQMLKLSNNEPKNCENEEGINEEDIKKIIENNKEAHNAITGKLHQRHEKLNKISKKITADYSEVWIEEVQDKNLYNSPEVSQIPRNSTLLDTAMRKTSKCLKVTQIELDTPKSTSGLIVSKRKRNLLVKHVELDSVSKKPKPNE